MIKTIFFVSLLITLSSQELFNNFYGQLGGYQNQIVQGKQAIIPLCFPNGFTQFDAPPNSCYREGFRGSISSRAGPCLPPIVNGKVFPPCTGLYFTLAKFR